MPGFAFQKGPDGKYVSTYDGPVYQGNAPLGTTGAAPVTGARRMEDDGRLVQRALTNVVPILGAQVPMVAGGIKGIQTLMQTGDPTKAWNAGAAETAAILKPISGMPEGPGMLWARTHYNASRNLTQSVLGNLPAAGSRKPGQADSPMLGFIPPLPKVKSSGGIEDFATGLVQTGMGVAASALALRAGGALLTPLVAAAPGGTAVLQGLGAASRLPATLRTAATAVQGIGGPSGALNTAANIARVGQIATEGAAIGALTNYAAFTPEEKTQADEWLGWAKGSNWLPLQEYIFSKPGDTEADARWKNAVFNLPIDATMNLGIHALGIAAKAAISRIPRSALGQAGQPAPQRPQPGVPAGQQTVDVTAQPVKEPAPTAEAPPAVVTPADVNKAVDNAATKLAHISTTVHPEMGPVTPENRGAWLPSFNQVREMPVSEIATDPKRLQSKAAGQATETGVTGSLEGVDVYNPLMGKPISVWQDPTDGKMYVVNGHNQLDLAKRSGIDNVLTWQIEAATAEEARAIGALENMGQGSGTAIDAAKVIREMGYSPEEIKARGIDLQGPVTRDAIALSRLPQATFNKVVAGKLDLDKAIALGSKEPTPAAPVVQAAPATPASLERQFANNPVARVLEAQGFTPRQPEFFNHPAFDKAWEIGAEWVGGKYRGDALEALKKRKSELSPEQFEQRANLATFFEITQRFSPQNLDDEANKFLNWYQSPQRVAAERDLPLTVAQRQLEDLYAAASETPTPAASAASMEFTMPVELSKSAPRYGRATIQFASDLDRAAYVLANDARNRLAGKPSSKAAEKFRTALEQAGFDPIDVAIHGREKVIPAIKEAAGGGAAPQTAMDLQIAAQQFVSRKAPAEVPALGTPAAPTEVRLYRGVPAGREGGSTVGDALFMSPDKAVAESYAGEGGTVSEAVVQFQNLLKTQNWMEAKAALGLNKSASMDELIRAARAAGHDGLSFTTTNGEEYIQINKAPAALAEPQAITPEVLGPGEMPQRVSDTPIADRFAEQIAKIAETDARMFRTIGELTSLTRKAIDELSGVTTPAADVTVISLEETSPTTVVPPVAAPEIQIPPDASRPLPPGSPRVDTVSQSISRWLGIGQEEARNLLLAKGEVLDVTKIPGMNLEKALDDKYKDFASPELQAVVRAYQRFYGPTSRQQRNELLAIADAVNEAMPNELPDHLSVSPELAQSAMDLITATVRQIAGDDVAIKFIMGAKQQVDTYGTHGQPGRTIEVGGSYNFNQEGILHGDPLKEIVDFTRIGLIRRDETREDYLIRNMMTAAHESFHNLQLRYLSSKQLRVLNTVFAKTKLALNRANRVRKGDIPVEKQAQGFGAYVEGELRGVDPTLNMFMEIDKADIDQIKEWMAGPDVIEKVLATPVNTFIEAIKIADNLTDFVEKVYNSIRGRGWTSIRDIFAQAAAGDIKTMGVNRGHVFEFNDLPGTVTDFMSAQNGDKEWIRRIDALRSQMLKEGKMPWQDLFDMARAGELFSEADQSITGMGGSLYSKVPEESGPARPSLPNGPENPSWATDFARLLDQYQNQLASGEITMEELYVLNRTQKTESPSGSQVYTADSQELIPGYAAMGQLLGDRPTFTGYPVRNPEETVKNNQAWFDTRQINGFNGGQVLAGLDAITNGFRAHEHGALNRAMAYADFLQKEAQIQAALWLNSANSGTSNKSERLATLITAVDKARRMHLAIANVTRPWGQMGLEMQLPRNYEIPTNVVEKAAPTTSIVDQAIMEELAKGDANPNGAFENITDVLDPELTHAAKGGEITVQAEAAADALADFVNSGGVDPAIRTQTWQDLESINNAKPGVAARTGPSGENPLQMLRVNNLISSGITTGTNLTNALFNIARLSAAQGVGAFVSGDMDRVMYSVFMLNTFLQNIDNAFRLGTHAIQSGKPLFNTTSGVLEHYNSMAAKDAQEALATANPNARTGWSLTTADMTEQFAKTTAGQVINAVWGTLGTGASRIAVGLDTFSATLSGHTFEHFNHMPRGMQLAVENKLPKYSLEAFEYASNYAKARVKETLKSVIIDGKNIADAVMTGPDAQKFMDAVNFTDNLHVDIEPRTLAEGMRLGQARGLKDGELTQWAQRYVDEGNLKHKIAEFGHATLGRIGNIPGDAMSALAKGPGLIGATFKFMHPFLRIPTNILKSIGRSTPGLNLFVDSFYRDIMSENPAVRERVRGEFLLGGGVLTAAIVATTHGRVRLNGNGPSDPIAKENWLKERKMVNSIQFWDDSTNTWGPAISTAAFEPYSSLFSAIGDYNDMAAGLPMEARTRLGASMALDLFRMQSLGMLNKTYFQGINELYQAAFDPNKAITGPSSRNMTVRLIERILAGMVPWSSASRAARRQVDPVARSVDPSQTGNFAMDFFQETIDEIRNQTPGLSDGLAGRRDWSAPGAPYMTVPQILGSEVVRDNPFLLGSMQFTPLSIMRVSDGPGDPVQAEMSRLHGKGTAFSGPRAADFGPEMRLTSSELSEYQRIFGTVKDVEGFTWHERVSKMVNSAEYMALPAELPSTVDVPERAARIQIWTDKFKKLAKDEYMRTTSKGAAIAAEEQRKAIRQAETLYGRKYGVSESQAPSSTQTFIQELTR